MAKVYCALIFLFLSQEVFSASCCGGGSSASSLILADHMQEWTFSTVYRSDIGQTNNDGQSMMDDDKNSDHTFTNSLEYKRIFNSRFQGSANLFLTEKRSERLGKKEKDRGIGDLSLGGFYEAFTNYYYNNWLPRVFLGIKVVIPFGENSFDSKKELRTDTRGTGFYKIDLPMVVARGDFKISATPQYLPQQKHLDQTFAFSTAGTYTYPLRETIDLSSTIQWNYLAKKHYENQNLVAGQYWDVSLSPSWAFAKDSNLNLSYTDSTLLGKSRNSALYRSLAMGITWAELL